MTAEPTFMIDHMLIGLGRYLRILGYDASWNLRVRTHDLIRAANEDGRVFLTCNTRIGSEYPAADRVMVLAHSDPVTQLNEVIAHFRLDAKRLFSKCIRCNTNLVPIDDKETIRSSVHPNVFARQVRFYRCPSCRIVFWHGSHVRNTCRKLGVATPERQGQD